MYRPGGREGNAFGSAANVPHTSVNNTIPVFCMPLLLIVRSNTPAPHPI